MKLIHALFILLLLLPVNGLAADAVYDYQYAIQMDDAWALVSGEQIEPVKIAIIDAGFNDSFGDFDNVVSYRNFVGATDTVNGDPVTGSIGTGHGTWCASIAGAEHDGSGMAGGAPNAELMFLRAFTDVGSHGDFWPMYYAIMYAINNGARIISISTGERWTSPTSGTCNPNCTTYRTRVQGAIDAALANNVLYVTGTGNSYDNLDNGTFWMMVEMDNILLRSGGLCTNYNGTSHPPGKDWYPPITYEHDLAGTTQYFDEIWYEPLDEPEYFTGNYYYGSNYCTTCSGTTKITHGVPAEDIYGLQYGEASGLSATGPITAGLAAIIMGINPWLTAVEVANIIKDPNNMDSISSTAQNVGGNYRINYYKAVWAAIQERQKVLKPRTINGELLNTTDYYGNAVSWVLY